MEMVWSAISTERKKKLGLNVPLHTTGFSWTNFLLFPAEIAPELWPVMKMALCVFVPAAATAVCIGDLPGGGQSRAPKDGLKGDFRVRLGFFFTWELCFFVVLSRFGHSV